MHAIISPVWLQVCKTLKSGNWTVEREEDLTGPYGFDDTKHWMSFDDATSLTIKTKYAILRNLGGMALFSIDADDADNVCGQGELSLLRSIFKTMTRLDRRPRQLVVHSLEEDLIAAPQTLSPVGVNVSPYRQVKLLVQNFSARWQTLESWLTFCNLLNQQTSLLI